jgi:hypothetical protein
MNLLNSIWKIHTENPKSDQQLRLLEVYSNSVKFRKLFLDFSENLEEAKAMNEGKTLADKNYDFLTKNETQLVKYEEINAIRIDEFVNFLKNTILSKLIKEQEDIELKALLKNLAKHEKHDVVSWAIKEMLEQDNKNISQANVSKIFSNFSIKDLQNITATTKNCETKEEVLGLYLLSSNDSTN